VPRVHVAQVLKQPTQLFGVGRADRLTVEPSPAEVVGLFVHGVGAAMIRDLIAVERDLGFRYETTQAGVAHYQQICPACRRAMFGLAQGSLWSKT
jgi:hypothetical protein